MSSALRLGTLSAWTALLASWGLIFVPALFGHLPSTAVVAELVGATLLRIDQVGVALGTVALACGARIPHASRRARLFAWLPLLGVACHLASWLWIAPEARAIREAAGGSVGLLAAGDPRIERFRTLHTLSFGVFAGASFVALACCTNALAELARFARRSGQKVRTT
jgi:hypothetical protein